VSAPRSRRARVWAAVGVAAVVIGLLNGVPTLVDKVKGLTGGPSITFEDVSGVQPGFKPMAVSYQRGKGFTQLRHDLVLRIRNTGNETLSLDGAWVEWPHIDADGFHVRYPVGRRPSDVELYDSYGDLAASRPRKKEGFRLRHTQELPVPLPAGRSVYAVFTVGYELFGAVDGKPAVRLPFKTAENMRALVSPLARLVKHGKTWACSPDLFRQNVVVRVGKRVVRREVKMTMLVAGCEVRFSSELEAFVHDSLEGFKRADAAGS
jgi:hypothetical protein